MTALALVEAGLYEAEYSLLASLAFENRRIDAVADIVAPEDFSDPFWGHVFGLVVSEHSQGRAANPITLRPLVESHPDYEQRGGTSFLANMANAATLTVPVIETARMIVRLAKRRRLLAGLSDSVALAEHDGVTLEEIIDAADEAIVTATHDPDSATERTGAAYMDRLLASMDAPTKGVLCRQIPPMDDLLGPLRPKQLVILAARPGMGKTATAISYATGAAKAGHGVLFVSLEMSGEELAARQACDLNYEKRSRCALEEVLADNPSRDVRLAVAEAAEELRQLPLTVVDTGKLTVGRLAMIVRRHARRMAAKGHSLDLVVVDYLQLLSPDTKGRSAYEAVSEVSRSLKAIAKDAGVAVLALAQLSREVEKRGDKRPQLSDLRDSGQIEQDADAVMFLLRPEYYLKLEEPQASDPKRGDWERAMQDAENKLEFICAKRRNGRTGIAHGRFIARYQSVRG